MEAVLCVPRAAIFPDGAWHGLVTTGLERILRVIRAGSAYQPRDRVEDDPSQQQIVPYCVVRMPAQQDRQPHNRPRGDGRGEHRYLLTRRLRTQTESRLHNLYSLGVGGHVNPGDSAGGDPVVGGLAREWGEEVVCPSPATARLVAVLNDDSNPVSQVHLGLVFLVEPTAERVTIREVEKMEGRCLPLEEIRPHYSAMETWSQLVFDDLAGGAVTRSRTSPLVVELAPSPSRD